VDECEPLARGVSAGGGAGGGAEGDTGGQGGGGGAGRGSGMSTSGRKSYAGGSGRPGATIDIDADITDA